MTWKGFALVLIPTAVTLLGLNWQSVNELEKKIESRVGREEFQRYVESQNRWQDRVDSRLDAITNADTDSGVDDGPRSVARFPNLGE